MNNPTTPAQIAERTLLELAEKVEREAVDQTEALLAQSHFEEAAVVARFARDLFSIAASLRARAIEEQSK